MSKLCNTCGAAMDDNAVFCSNCGAKFEAPAPVVEPAPAAEPAPVVEPAPAVEPTPLAEPAPAPQPAPAPAPQYAPAPQQVPAPQYAPGQPAPQYVPAPRYAPGQPAPQYAPAQPAPQPAPAPKQIPVPTPAKKSNAAKIIITLVIIAALAVAAVLAVPTFLPSPTNTTKKLMKAFEAADAEALVDLHADFLFEDEDAKGEFVEELDEMFSELDDVEYEIKDESDLSKSEIKDIEKTLKSTEKVVDDFNADDVTEYKKVKVKYSCEIDGEKVKETVDIILVKYQKKWVVYSGLVDIPPVGGPEAIVDMFWSAYIDVDGKTLAKLVPDFLWAGGFDNESELAEMFEEEIADIEIDSIEYKINSNYKYSDSELIEVEEYIDYFEMAYGVDSDSISEFRLVRVDVDAVEYGEPESYSFDFVLINYNGEWKILSTDSVLW